MNLRLFVNYLVYLLAQGNVEYKTKTINNSTEPRWNEVCENLL